MSPKAKRIANQEARDKLLHKVLTADARTLLIRYGEVDVRDFVRVLARAHGTTTDRVQKVLENDQQFELSGGRAALRTHAGRDAPTPTAARSDASLADDIRFALSEADTDRVDLLEHSATPGRQIRCDFVRGDRGEEIWLATVTRSTIDWSAASEAGAWTFSADLRLPLVRSSEAAAPLPAIQVFREASAGDAANRALSIIEGIWGARDDQVRMEKSACSPAELERRVLGEQTVRRLIARTTSRDPAVRTCERCGQPLTDPGSVELGIGPECRKHYSPEILRAVRARSNAMPKSSAQKPSRWAIAIREWLASAGQQ